MIGKRNPNQALLEARINAEAAAEQHARKLRDSGVRLALNMITDSVVGFDGAPSYGADYETFAAKVRLPQAHDSRHPARAARLSDGVAVVYTSRVLYSDRIHQLFIPKSGEPSYDRESVNTDVQTMPAPAVHLEGFEAFAAQPDIVESLQYCLGALSVEAAYEWRNAYRLPAPHHALAS
ncbi:MAG: hypothetical protein JWN38_24 [Candidatus Saccharibacteria bacterium]|nr:hypothetical protein [Candidatus Saccharibacteria bacterium]